MADFLVEVQPHEREARNDKGPRRMPQPFGLNGLNLPATHAARPTAADVAGGADVATVFINILAVQRGKTLSQAMKPE